MVRKAIKIPNTEKDINFARELAAHGSTNKKIAELFGIGLTTLEKWLRGDSKFTRAIKKGRNVSCQKVIDSVFQRACGYNYIEEVERPKIVIDADGNPLTNEDGSVREEYKVTQRNRKHALPDIPAAKFYLWNKTKMLPKDEQWNDKQHLDHSSSDSTMSPREMIQSDMTPQEAARLFQQTIRDQKVKK